ncbi:MAG TPA: carboxypeptidase-like regulatory domain-containing protein [Bryobacteraceae bacterium]
MRTMFVFVCLFVLVCTMFGQAGGTLTGVITDPTGAVVPNASIEVKNSETGAVYRGGTSATGNYTIPVPQGTYELTATITGFKRYVRQNLEVSVASTVRWDVKLEVGATSEAVTVTDVTPLLKTESGDVSHNVTSEQARNLPLLTISAATGFGQIRNPLAVTSLLPGVQYSADFNLRINGMPSNTETIRIKARTPPTAFGGSKPRSASKVSRPFRKWPFRPATTPRNSARQRADTSISR